MTVRYAGARQAGLTEDKIAALDDLDSNLFSPRERAALRRADGERSSQGRRRGVRRAAAPFLRGPDRGARRVDRDVHRIRPLERDSRHRSRIAGSEESAWLLTPCTWCGWTSPAITRRPSTRSTTRST